MSQVAEQISLSDAKVSGVIYLFLLGPCLFSLALPLPCTLGIQTCYFMLFLDSLQNTSEQRNERLLRNGDQPTLSFTCQPMSTSSAVSILWGLRGLRLSIPKRTFIANMFPCMCKKRVIVDVSGISMLLLFCEPSAVWRRSCAISLLLNGSCVV